MIIRNPKEEEINEIIKLTKKTFSEFNFSKKEWSEIIKAVFNRSTLETSFIAIENNQLIGFVLAEFREWWWPPKLGYIYLLTIHPDYQKKGLGKKLLEKTIKKFESLNATQIELACEVKNKKALELYKKRGFLPDYFLLNLPIKK